MRCRDDGCEREARPGRTRCAKCSYDGSSPLLPHLSSAPLVAIVEARGGPTECGAQEFRTRRAYTRAKATGTLTVWAADLLSHALLGVHPVEIWPDWYGETASKGTKSMDEWQR